MKRIIVIGCPGSGKSVFTRRINQLLGYPVLHLDRIYHTGGKLHITRDELLSKVNDFVKTHDKWIIDGNYISTLDMRVKLADTIIWLNIPTSICLTNVLKRAEESLMLGVNRDDMAKGFDNTITAEFIDFIEKFTVETMPRIREILNKHCEKAVYIINSYTELDQLIAGIEK